MNRYPTLDDIKQSKVAHLNTHILNRLNSPELKKKSKYGNKKVELDGHKFDSKKEARRYIVLRQLQTIGEISDLRLQVAFKLSVCTYYADFVYNSKEGLIIEDVKGFRNRVYLMKKKMMFLEKGIEIKET